MAQLVASAYPVVSLLIEEGKAATHAALTSAVRARGAPVYVASRAVVSATVGFDLHRGVVAAGRRLPPATVEDVVEVAGTRPLLVVEGVNDHENLGALFRNAAALGAGGILLDPTCADPLYRRSVRVSLGHVLRVPFAVVHDWPAGLAGAGRELVALTPAPDAEPLARCRPARPIALAVGAEGRGLSPELLAVADRRVRIPMAAGVDSLNVATAAAITLHRYASRPC